MATEAPPGYTYGTGEAARSPVTDEDLALLEATVLLGPDDERALARAAEVLEGRVEDVLDVWYGFVAANPHLVAHFADPGGRPIGDYLGRVRARFGRWILDTCRRPRDRAWLDYQEEIALRHTAAAKNRTDGVDSTPAVPLRYMIAFVHPITATIRPFLEAGGDDPATVDAMHQAWFKAVTLQVALWARPYAPEAW